MMNSGRIVTRIPSMTKTPELFTPAFFAFAFVPSLASLLSLIVLNKFLQGLPIKSCSVLRFR